MGEMELNADPFDKSSGGWAFEQALLDKVRRGDLSAGEYFAKARNGEIGKAVYHDDKHSMDAYRQNTIVLLTLVSRAAVDGGLPQKVSFSLCTEYRKKTNAARTSDQLVILNQMLVEDYTTRVHAVKLKPESSLPIRQCCEYIKNHLGDKLTLSVLADKTGYAESHLSRKFKQEMGCSIVEYIQTKRLERAKYLLEKTDRSVDDIADELNFSTRSYFSSVFKQHEGITPSEYRHNHAVG